MDIKAKKLELVELILHINKPSLLARIEELIAAEEEQDWWDELPSGVRQQLEESIKEADAGELFDHDDVIRETKAKYKLK